jgi:hypothetical protein
MGAAFKPGVRNTEHFFRPATVHRDIADTDGAAAAGGMSGDALEERNREIDIEFLFVALRKHAFQLSGLFVPYHYVEEMIVDDFLDAVRDALEPLLVRKDRSQFAADVEQQRKTLVLFDSGNRCFLSRGLSRRVTHVKARPLA